MVYAEAERCKGICHHHLGQTREAARIQESALRHYRLLGEKESIARVPDGTGNDLPAGGNYSSALNAYQEALAEWQRVNNLYSQGKCS